VIWSSVTVSETSVSAVIGDFHEPYGATIRAREGREAKVDLPSEKAQRSGGCS